MLPNPSTINKYLYIEKTPTWKVRLLYGFGIFSWILIMLGYWNVIGIDPFYSFFVIPIFILLSIYHLASFGLNLFYRQFDLLKHFALVKSYDKEPPVDIFLPICGEEVDVLRNTWEHVSNINYKNKTVYVLDDSKENFEAHKELAQHFGFVYMERPNKGHMKKAGNLKHTFERSNGHFIAIFDADFAPHPDFIKETLPYMDDPTVGIVQTPQYFDLSDNAYKKSKFAYNAAFAEEPFYRFIQVTRSRFGGAICCGSCALYRRSAIEAIGGPYQIEYSEDAHTGYAISRVGLRVLFVPILLSIGLCPDNQYAFFHQQHRWCMGSLRLMLSKFFWKGKTSWKTKFCFITGFMFYLHHPLMILFSFHLFWTLFLYNEYIPLGKSLLFYPHLIFAIVYLWLFPVAKFRFGYFGILMARTYAYSHAVKTALFKKSVGWVSTNAKHKSVSHAFSQTTRFVTIYFTFYTILILIGLRTGDIHLFDIDYFSIQFWIFWNFIITFILVVQMRNTKRRLSEIPPLSKRINYAFSHIRANYLTVSQIIIFISVFATVSGFTTYYLFDSATKIKEVSALEILSPVATVNAIPSVTPSPITTEAPSPTPTRKPAIKKKTEEKVPGGWYWREELEKSQQWLGMDARGNDIWHD